MFKPVAATDIESYINSIAEPRKSEILAIDTFIKNAVPSLEPNFLYNMLGYGILKYRNYKKEIIDWPIIGLANHKNYISIYVSCIVDGQYLAERNKNELGKVSVGKSCIRFKKFADVNVPALERVLKEAAENPGFALEK